MSPSTWVTRSVIPCSAMISRPTAALAGRSSTVAWRPGWRRQSSAENQPCPPATSSRRCGPGGRRRAPATVGSSEAGEFELAPDVPAPMLVVGREIVDLHASRRCGSRPPAGPTSPGASRQFSTCVPMYVSRSRGRAICGRYGRRRDRAVLCAPRDRGRVRAIRAAAAFRRRARRVSLRHLLRGRGPAREPLEHPHANARDRDPGTSACRTSRGRRAPEPGSSGSRSARGGLSGSRPGPHREAQITPAARAPSTVSRSVARASCLGRQRSCRRALPVSMRRACGPR